MNAVSHVGKTRLDHLFIDLRIPRALLHEVIAPADSPAVEGSAIVRRPMLPSTTCLGMGPSGHGVSGHGVSGHGGD